jgi:hypothetical protein
LVERVARDPGHAEPRVGPQAEVIFLRSFGGDGFTVAELEDDDIPRMAELVDTYLDLPLGIVDAAVIAIAERLRLAEVATIDHRHFSVVRPRHVPAFTLLPARKLPESWCGCPRAADRPDAQHCSRPASG